MSGRTKLAPDEQMTVEEFLAFTDTRPNGERWELVEGVAVLTPGLTEIHQLVTANVCVSLRLNKDRTGAPWFPLFGVCVRAPASPCSLPTPDVFVKEGPTTGSPITADALAIFEVLSEHNSDADQAWRRKVYASVANCRHYVTVSLKTVEAVVYDRDSHWSKRLVASLNSTLDLPAIGVSIPLTDIYRWTPLGNDAA